MDAEHLVSAAASVEAQRLVTPWAGHTLAGEIELSAVFGDIESRSQLLGGGGIDGMRGFFPGELFGRAQLLFRGEYRHSFVHDLDWNLGHYLFVHGLGGVLFADVGALSPCESYDLGAGDSWYASAGYGLQMMYDNFGTLAGLTRIDVALRLQDHDRSCLGSDGGSFPPVAVYVSFLPPF
jgi:hypothetical protein